MATTTTKDAGGRARTATTHAPWAAIGGQLGFGLVALGLLFILLAWNGAAGKDYDQGQIPYLISGGAGGLGLIIAGVALAMIQNSRRDRSLLESKLDEVAESLSRLTAALSSYGGDAANGRAAPRRAAAEPEVVLGRSSFHRPGCRLVAGKDLPGATADAALEEGLSACRICNPLDEPAPAFRR